LCQIEQDEICASISADGTVTFSDPPSHFSKSEIDKVLRDVQQQGALLAALNKEIGKSKEFISKVNRNILHRLMIFSLSHSGEQKQG
jgi:COP9 signalosome complex subunit 3